MANSLVKYVRKCISQGYDISSISNTLLSAGYSQSEINEAIQSAQQPEKFVPSKILLMSFIVVLVAVVLIFLSIKLLTPKYFELDLSLRPQSIELVQGQQLLVSAEIVNLGERQTSAFVSAVVTGPEERSQKPTESVTLRDSASVLIKHEIRNDARPGVYTLAVTLNYDGPVKTKTQQFLVKEKVVFQEVNEEVPYLTREEKMSKELLLCPGGCDDFDRCTLGACIDGVCVFTPIVPCCGNNICEPGESFETCPQDCRPVMSQIVSEDQIKSAEQCQEQVGVVADNCFRKLAEQKGDYSLCEFISDNDIRDACYMEFAYRRNFDVCENITNRHTKTTCFTFKSVTNSWEEARQS